MLSIRQRNDAVRALSQVPCRELVELLVDAGPAGLPAGVIASELDVLQGALLTDLTALLHAGLIECEIRGPAILYRADLARFSELLDPPVC